MAGLVPGHRQALLLLQESPTVSSVAVPACIPGVALNALDLLPSLCHILLERDGSRLVPGKREGVLLSLVLKMGLPYHAAFPMVE